MPVRPVPPSHSVRPGLRPRPAALLLLAAAACLSDRVVAPPGALPAVIGIDKPTVQFVRFALGRSVAADTVRITNNGEQALGTVSAGPEIEYISGTRTGWLAAAVVPQGNDTSALVLTPTYADSAGSPPDTARVTLHAAGAQAGRVVTVIARTIPGARFEFSANPVTFASVPGGPPTVDQAFSVRNGGNGDLPIYPPRLSYASAARDWLVVSAVPGSDPKAPSFDLTAKTGTLSTGLHTAYVVFESPPGDPTRAPPDSFVVQTRIGAPRLAVSSGVVSFSGIRGGAEVESQTITLTNAGEGTLESLGDLSLGAVGYKAGEPTGWLAATLAGNTVVLTPTTGSLPASSLTAQLPVTSQNGGDALLTITFEVRLPGLTLSSKTLSFNAVEGGTSPGVRSITISNSGSGSLATLGALSIAGVVFPPGQAAGWLTATLQDSVVTVAPTLGQLGAGTYAATVQVTSQNGGGEVLAVTFTVARANDPPVLTLSATTLTLSGTRGDPNPAPQTVAISNTGGGSLGVITIGTPRTTGGNWLSASVNGTNIVVNAITGALASGTYIGSFTVTGERGGSTTVTATFTVGVPVLTLSAVTTSFGATEGAASPASNLVTISNSGSGTISSLGTLTVGTISYGPGQPTGWLTAARTATTITLSATTGALHAGLYTATVPVASANGGASGVAVTFSVAKPVAQPVLALSSASLSFSAPFGGANPPSQSVSFFNSGGGVNADLGSITAPVPVGAPWLTAVVGAGGVTFTAAVGSLAAGVRTATVPVTAATGGTANVAVTFTIADANTPPVLALSSTAAAFAVTQGAANPPNQTITTSNAGGSSLGTLSVGAVTYTGTSTGWLTRTLNAGTGVITLSAATVALPAGVSTATFVVSTSPAATGSPATVTVSLTVVDAPAAAELTLSATTVSFAAPVGGAQPAAQTVTALNTGGGGLAGLGTLTRGTIVYTPSVPGWLTTANITAATGVLNLRPTTGTLAQGVYQATFPVTASGAGTGSPAPVTVTFTVARPSGGAADSLTLSSQAVSFAAIEGGASPLQKTVAVSNTGPGGLGALGTLSVDSVTYAGATTGWLTVASVNPTSGVVSLRPTTGSLTPGTYQALVWVAGTAAAIGSPQTVEVAFTITKAAPAPILRLSAQTASFAATAGGASPAPSTVDLLNLGGGTLGAVTLGTIVYAGTSTGWLSAAHAAGVLTLTPTTTSLGVGSSTATFTVTSAGTAGSPRTVTVYLTVAPRGTPPGLSLSTEAVSFAGSVGGAAPASQVIAVSNTGGGSLGTITLGAITYAGGSPGWLTNTLAGANLTMNAAIGARTAGTYSATFPVSSAAAGVTGSPVTVTARLTVAANAAPPVLTLATQAVSFAVQAGANPLPQTVAAINTGGGTLASLGSIGLGTITYGGTSSGWLGTSVSGGIITLTPTAAGLPSGSSTASFQVASANGGSSPLSVTLTVAAPNAAPTLALSLLTVTFDAIAGGTPPNPQVVTVSNAGGGTLGAVTIGTETFVPSQPSGWLASPVSGASISGGINFAVASSGLPAGVYTAAVPVTTANAGAKTIAVTLRVQAPILTLSTRAVSFSATQGTSDPASQTVTVSNTGIGTLASLGAISVGAIRYGTGAAGWLRTTTAGSTVTLTAHLGALPSGTFTASVPIVSAFGGTDVVTATFTVAPGAAPPVLALSSGLVSFSATVAGANPTPQAVTFSNSGGQTLGAVRLGAASPAAPWLNVSLAGNQITFSADVTGLPAGAYATRIPVETDSAGSANIGVALTVGAPRIALSTTSVTFGDTVGSTRALTSDVFISNSGAGDLASLGALRIGTVTYGGLASGWLQSPVGGSALANPIVSLSAAVGALAAGTYTATIPVTSEQGGSATITLTMAVNSPDPAFDRPSIQFFQDGVTIDSAVASRVAGDTAQFAVRVKIGNPNNTAIALSGLRVGAAVYVRGTSGWITGAFLDETSAPFGSPAELLVAIRPAGLAAGRYRADIEVRSDVAKNSPRKLSVVLVVQ